MYLLIPGRHHLLTQFQFEYLLAAVRDGLSSMKDINGQKLAVDKPVEAIIFAVTSSNHSNTRRNPLPFYLRAISIEAMAAELPVPVYTYGIDDVGVLNNFASYTVKRIQHESDGLLYCTPENTIVVCSTPVLKLYEQLGFRVLPAELESTETWKHHTAMPWDIVEEIAKGNFESKEIDTLIHASSKKVWSKYGLAQKIKTLFADPMIGNDGDLTTTRDYNVYVRQMDEIAAFKYEETAAFIQPGRIGDIGCAVGSWIKLATDDSRFRESDFYGIEISRHLFELCRQRKENGEFKNPFVFFSQKNAVTGLVFEPFSMNSIHTSSLTHEIESYGSRNDLLQFIQNRYEELVPGGVWINRDVTGPYNKEQEVLLWLNEEDGTADAIFAVLEDRYALSKHLKQLSTHARFVRFARDFRHKEGYKLPYEWVELDGKKYARLRLADAAEFMSRKDYTDNWQSEMHETFCYWDFEEWKQQLKAAGFSIHPSSKAYTNEWIVNNRLKGRTALFSLQDGVLLELDYPVSHMLLIGVRK